jgi:hypothetical protein
MKIISLISFWQLFKWVVLIVLGYALVRAGVPASVICLLLLIRLAIRLAFHFVSFIGGMIRIAIMFALIVFLFYILQTI